MSILFYKRPDYIAKDSGPLDNASCQKYVERAACGRASIPPNLSFENVMDGKTLPVSYISRSFSFYITANMRPQPCSLQDFLDYLVYIAHDAENLQFYLWYLDYSRRFKNLPESERRLSPEWKIDGTAHNLGNMPTGNYNRTSHKSGMYGATVLSTMEVMQEDAEHSRTDSLDSLLQPSTKLLKAAVEAEVNAQDKPLPSMPLRRLSDTSLTTTPAVSIQPFRTEISQILSHYIHPASPRELNISHQTRSKLLHALQHTTHPSVFQPVIAPLLITLKNQSHPNFVRWTICNGNKPRVLFLRSLAVTVLSSAIIMSVLLILSHRARWWRIFCIIPFWFGTVNFVAAYKGLCVLLYRRHVRELNPWELEGGEKPRPSREGLMMEDSDRLRPPKRTRSKWNQIGFDRDVEANPLPSNSLSPASSVVNEKLLPLGGRNVFLHEPWVAKWRRREWWRKLKIKKVWVQEEGLRLIQNKIVKQAHAWGVLVSVTVTIGVVACPVVGVL